MKQRINETQMTSLIDFVKNLCGNDLSSKRDILKQKLTNFCDKYGFESAEELMDQVPKRRSIKQELINNLTINETYFMREATQLKAVINYLNSLQSYTSILCAPCSSGEEVYTLGMLAKTCGMDMFKLKITGIDINSNVIEKCKVGKYNARSLQNVSASQKSTFFEEDEDGMFKIKKSLMPRIDFKTINLFDDSIYALGTFDVILSRNMLIYFDDYHRAISLDKFYKLLKPDGRLYVGNADIVPSSEIFRKVFDMSATYYEKVNLY